MTNSQAPQPVDREDLRISLVYDHDGAGGYFAQLRVTGMRTEKQAQAVVAHLQHTFCGDEIHVN